VQGFRHLIDTQIQESLRLRGERHSLRAYPATIIRGNLAYQGMFAGYEYGGKDNQLISERGTFYAKLGKAWDAIAYDHYRRRDGVEDWFEMNLAGRNVSGAYQLAQARGESRPEIITLDPLQTQILDALAEAADIPHQRGQSEIEIPEKLRDYHRE
jgi:hypothetical protein